MNTINRKDWDTHIVLVYNLLTIAINIPLNTLTLKPVDFRNPLLSS